MGNFPLMSKKAPCTIFLDPHEQLIHRLSIRMVGLRLDGNYFQCFWEPFFYILLKYGQLSTNVQKSPCTIFWTPMNN